jgi:parallel beta-helix repeat protein
LLHYVLFVTLQLFETRPWKQVMVRPIQIITVLTLAAFSCPGVIAQQDPLDQGNADSILMIVSGPNIPANDSSVAVELYFYNDVQDLDAATVGFSWVNPNLQMDSAGLSAGADSAFDFLEYLYYKDDLDSTNLRRLFQFAGVRLFGSGLPAGPTPKLVATYWFHLEAWNMNDSLCFDTLTFSDGTKLKFISGETDQYRSVWRRPECVYAEAYAGPVWYVDTAGDDLAGDGSPGNPFKTIQKSVDTATGGDTVRVAPGTFTGDGNRDINFGGKSIVLKSKDGPEVTIIDCGGSIPDPHRGFFFAGGETSTSIVDGFTIKNGYEQYGGGIRCLSSSPTIVNNIITGNSAEFGGGISCESSTSPTVSGNTIIDNTVTVSGGGIHCWASNPTIGGNSVKGNAAQNGGGVYCGGNSSAIINHNTIVGNSASYDGGGFYCISNSNPIISNNTIVDNSSGHQGSGLFLHDSSPTLESTILAFNSGGAITCGTVTSAAILICCDVYGNDGGDWVGCIADQAGIDGNFSTDPLFCDSAAGEFYIDSLSQCAPDHPNNGCGILIGAKEPACLAVCCTGPTMGNVDCQGIIDVGDVTEMIKLLFISVGQEFCCEEEADLDFSSVVDVGDLTMLIQSLFITLDPLDPCPY